MKKFLKEYRRISAKDLPQEIHMGWSLVEKCGDCFHPLGLKVQPKGFDKGTYIIYCPSCNRECERVELEGLQLAAFSLEVAARSMGGAA